jgi:hypothetical protein
MITTLVFKFFFPIIPHMYGRNVIDHQPIMNILLTLACNGNPTKHHPLSEIHQSSTYDKDPTKQHPMMEIPPTIKKINLNRTI